MEQANNQQQTNQGKQDEQGTQQKPQGTGNDVQDNKLFAVLGYLGILFLIPLLAKKDSPYAQFHAKQGMVLFIIGFVSGFVIWVPIIGWVVGICLFVLWIMGVINALSGNTKKLPVIGDLADKINI